MTVCEAKTRFGEKLEQIEDLRENGHAHYLRVEEAVANASISEIQAHYACVHGMLPEDAVVDPRFPWHPEYQYGDAKKCCDDCMELEMALAVNLINAYPSHPLLKYLPELEKLASGAAAAPEGAV